jgi:hypothetical protein
MGYRTRVTAALIAASLAAYGQKLDLSSLDGLAARAKKTENVTLDAEKLKLASQFLSNSEKDDAKQIISRLTGVFVRTFEFDKPVTGSFQELQPIRAQLTGPGWSKIVDVKDRDQNEETEVYLFSKDGNMGGLAVISADKNELTVVNVAGAIGLNELKKLRGNLGIPGLAGPNPPAPPASPPNPPNPPNPPQKDE